jgi:hypothetical protein
MPLNISNFAAEAQIDLAGITNSGIVSVKSFGAMGDGVTDDTAAINAALATVTVTGGQLFFPPGIYIVSSTITVPGSVQLRGTGIDYLSLLGSVGGTPVQASVIRAKAGFNASTPMVRLGSIQYPNANWYTDQNTGTSAHWMIFDANSAAQSAVQTFGTRCRLDHCEMRNGLSFALDISGQNTQCIGCITDNNDVGVSLNINANDAKYLDGEVRSGATAHCQITGSTGNTMIDGNDIYGGQVCPSILVNVTASLTLGRISNNHINPTGSNGIQIVVSAAQTLWGAVIVANKIYGPTGGIAGGSGLRVDVQAAGSAIDGLVFNDNVLTDKSNGQRSGAGFGSFIARAASTGTVRNSVVVGNHANGMGALFGGAFVPTVQYGNTWVDNSGVSHQSSQEGSFSTTGDGATTAFTVAHNINSAPSQVVLSPTSSAASAAAWVSAKAAANFTITFAVAPANAAAVTFDWTAKA